MVESHASDLVVRVQFSLPAPEYVFVEPKNIVKCINYIIIKTGYERNS